MRPTGPTLAFAAALAFPLSAGAITQPNGTTIPATGDLQALFDRLHDPISALHDGNVLPETFVPGCSLSFTLVTRGTATFHNTFGWYNVTGHRPTDSELHELISCNAHDGDTATFDVRTESDYTGGAIGFFLRTPQSPPGEVCADGNCCAQTTRTGLPTYFTERRYNSDSQSLSTAYIHLLTFDSRSTPQAFYFAWEDLYNGGDNQFTDFVARVGNIVCAGAGGACDTGMTGACSSGTMQCRAGALACTANATATTERCDGVDNDCNGTADDGTDAVLCGDLDHVCDRGVCVIRCVEGACFEGQTCSARGTCVDVACAAVTCAAGTVCAGGTCRAPCDGIVCPSTQACRAGRCVDACAGVTCDGDQLCVAGVCQPRCECRPCGSGNTCSAGRCVQTACATVTCEAGSVCASGACVDACAGVTCPTGETCRAGQCTAVLDAGAPPDVATIDVTVPARDASVAGPDVTVVRDAAMPADARTESDARTAGPPRGTACNCRTVGIPTRNDGLYALALAGATAMVQRRRRSALSRST